MSHFERLLPQRNLRFIRKPLAQGLGLLLICLLPLAAAIFIGWLQLPGLLQDLSIRADPVELDDYALRNGECTTRKAVFTDCSADVAYRVDGTMYEQHIELMFVSFHRGDYDASLVIDGKNPANATLSIGLERFWNRVIVFVLLVGLIAAAGVGGIVVALRTMRANRAARTPQRWTPECVVVQSAQKSMGGLVVTYGYQNAAGGKVRKASSRFGRKQSPLFIESGDETTLVLALRPVSGGVPLLLDEALQRIDLSERERSEIERALTTPAAG